MTRNIALLLTTISLPLLHIACGGTTLASPGGDAGASDGSPPPTGDDSGPTVISCPTMLTACAGECVDTLTDINDCGYCGNRCGAGGVCSSGVCASELPDSGLPTNPGGPTPGSSPDLTLAVHTFYLGDSNRNGVMSAVAWEGFGLNIDGKDTTAASTDVCTLYVGAARSTQVDGPGGIDNSFGENILPIILTVFGENYSQTINDDISTGQSGTMMFALGSVGAGADYFPLSGAVFTADALSFPPTWSGSDVWPIDSSSVSSGSVTSPLSTFPQSYMNNRTWVSAPSSATDAVQVAFTADATIPVLRPQILMTVADDNSRATNGTLAGVIDTQQFISILQSVAGQISTSLCSGTAFESIATQIEQASDILGDGTNEAGVPCNAISIGIGFDAIGAELGGVVTPAAPPNPCSP
jgi:hypothetical protein